MMRNRVDYSRRVQHNIYKKRKQEFKKQTIREREREILRINL